MSAIFLKILNMSAAASWIAAAVLLLRCCLKRAPKWVNVLLWGFVAVRLLFPFSIESALSLLPRTEVIRPAVTNAPVQGGAVTDLDDPCVGLAGRSRRTASVRRGQQPLPAPQSPRGRPPAGQYLSVRAHRLAVRAWDDLPEDLSALPHGQLRLAVCHCP